MTALPLELARTLAAIAETGSLDGGAKALGITPSAVSQRLKTLETTLGQLALIRSKPVRLTPVGQSIVHFAHQAELLEQDALRALGISGGTIRSRFRISIEPDLRERWTDAIAAATADTPMDVEVYDEALGSSGQPEIYPTIVVTTQPDALPGFQVVPLGESRFDAVATPEFIERWGGARPGDEAFAAAPVIVVRGREERHRTFSSSIGLNVSKSTTVVSSTASAVAFLLSGAGWGLIPRVDAARAVRLGRLHRISTAFIAQPYFLWVGEVSSSGVEAITTRLRAAAETAFGAERTGIAQGGLSDETA